MKKRLLKVLGGVVAASPLIVMLVIGVHQGDMQLAWNILALAGCLATSYVGLWLMGAFE